MSEPTGVNPGFEDRPDFCQSATPPPPGELIVYQGQGLQEPIQVRLEGETVWLSQKLMAELYDTTAANVNQRISAIYADEELQPEATIKKYLIVQSSHE